MEIPAFVPFHVINTPKIIAHKKMQSHRGTLFLLVAVFSPHAFKQGFTHFIEKWRWDIA